MKKLFWFAVFLAIIAAMSNLIVQVMKSLWARQRFRTMTEGHPKAPEDLAALGCANYEGFTHWWQINVFAKPEIMFVNAFFAFSLARLEPTAAIAQSRRR